MKKLVTVTITKELEIDIPDDFLSAEAIAEFTESFWPVADANELIGYAAVQIAVHGEQFVEGFGPARDNHSKDPRVITFKELSDETDYEIS